MTHSELESQLNQAFEEANKGNFDVAEKRIEEVLAELLQPNNPSELSGRQIQEFKAKAFNTLGIINSGHSDYILTLEYFEKALIINQELGNKQDIARNLGNIGNTYQSLSEYTTSLHYFQKALSILEELEDTVGIARNLGNIGMSFWYLSNFEQALVYSQKALALFEKVGNTTGIASNLCSIAAAYFGLLDYTTALEINHKALGIFEKLSNKIGIAGVLGNIGSIYWHISDFSLAIRYFQNALACQEELGSQFGIANNIGNIGTVYANQSFEGYDAIKAEEYFNKSIEMTEMIGARNYLYKLHLNLADLYKNEKRWEESVAQFEKYHNLYHEVQSEEAKKEAGLMDQRRKVAEREKEIAIASATHEATVQLLHNVLPPSIADRLLASTKVIAEKLTNVSVLFADIVDFTELSQRITPEELVDGLDKIFGEFDTLAEKYNVEKIKTIGDCYMVVAGAPKPRADHAETMAMMALDMIEVMKQFTSITSHNQVQLRIGIHCGDVVAGVIGKKKFAYDMWGDAVNTASRMESHGEAGKIHCSTEFVRALSLSSLSSLRFVERSEMNIKGKGKMKTYFLERIH